jgi:hypothetical protein
VIAIKKEKLFWKLREDGDSVLKWGYYLFG